jgi:AraC-like DNA-binding protein
VLGEREVRAHTLKEHRRVYLQARLVIERHYAKHLTVDVVARALATSPRQVQRAYERFGESTFREDLLARRMRAAAELLAQRAIPVSDVARLVGYRQPSHFAKAFRKRYGVSPARFRTQLRAHSERPADGREAGAEHAMLNGDALVATQRKGPRAP